MKSPRDVRAEPLVYVIVANHNGLRYLEECFRTLLASEYPNFRVMMMDNASTDGSVEFVRRNFPSVIVVHNPRNLWFAGGNNVAMRRALDDGAEHVALLNNDTAADAGWIREMVRVIESSADIGAVAARLMYYTNRRLVNGIGVSVSQFAYATDRWQAYLYKEEYGGNDEVMAVTGGACLFRAEALKQAGLFDAHYKAYFEDIDLSFRIRGAGWRIVAAPKAVVYHKYSAYWGAGSMRQQYWILRNRLLLMMKFFPLPVLARKLAGSVRREQVALLKERVRSRDLRAALSQLAALLAGLRFAPAAALFRLRNRGRFGRRFYDTLVPVRDFTGLPYMRWDFRKPAGGDSFPERIIFGVNDAVLGDGWLPLTRAGFPRARWMGGEAECFLGARAMTPSVIQLHVRQPYDMGAPQRLAVSLDGAAVGEVEVPHGEWRTYHLRCTPGRDVARVAFRLDRYHPADPRRGIFDSGLQFDEASLLPEGSPFLRDAVP